ncbi:MAG: nuclear transport factor 2 family protein [Desulfobulbaceae bacterium]|nr:nuclear transport factor 2 family protein [Desulfobulbaceae bacterium]
MSSSTEIVLQSYFQAARDGVDAVMQDFTDDSVLITHVATCRGLTEIRQFFTTLLDGLPEGFFDAFKMNRQDVVGELAYTLWEAKPWLPLATDTFVVRNGKILFQTFTACTASEG